MWIVFALSLVACTSTLGILFRVAAVRSDDPRTFSFLMNMTALGIAALAVAITGVGQISLRENGLWLILISGFGYGMFQRYQFLVRKHIEASRIGLIFAPTSFAGYILAILWLNESVSLQKLLGYVLIFFATVLILYRKRAERFEVNRYVIIALLIGGGLSIAATIDRAVTPGFESALTYTLVIWAAQTLACFLPSIRFKQALREVHANKFLIPLLAVINVGATYFLVAALQRAPATQVMPIANSNVIVIALLGIIFLKERSRLWVKISAALIATLGLLLISQ
jgi:drug/metabolite transporter (DMT)-like permease